VLEHLWKELEIDAVVKRCAARAHTKQPFERALFTLPPFCVAVLQAASTSSTET
jgi:hypothetical protein